ncbi:MAG TPA: hypothetical protein VGL23_11520 [Chloroflexota bacterium]|jgi:hypothetical protein
MTRRGWFWLVAIALVAAGRLFAADAAAAAEPTISISGAVVNGTVGGAAPTDAPVSVIGISGRRAFEQARSTAGPGGRFEVTDLPAAPDLTYVVRVDHAGVPYLSDPVQSSNGPARELTVKVFERTEDSAALEVERHSLVVLEPAAGQRTLQMRETVVLRNRGDRTWAPAVDGAAGPMGLLRFSLPDGAADLQLGRGLTGQPMLADRGFGLQMPIPPGRREFSFSYRVEYGASSYRLRKTLVYPTALLEVEVPSALGPQVLGPGDVPVADQAGSARGATARFEARDLAARGTVALDLKSLPGAPRAVLEPAIRWGVLGLGLLAAAGAAAYAAWRSRSGPAADVDSELALVRQLAALDLLRQRDRLSEQEHSARRASVLEALVGARGGGA